jgi:hypothetical protein
MANHSFVAYIDESGDEGFKFSRGSSDWFVLTAVVIRKDNDTPAVKLVDTVRARLKKDPKKALHFRNLSHGHKVPYIGEIALAPIRTISIAVHKPSLNEPEKFNERYRLHHYSVRLLLERVSWLCRDTHHPSRGGDGSVKIIFSNRAGMSYQEIKDYLELLRRNAELWDVRIDWNVVKTSQISANVHSQRNGLQIADAVASGIYSALQETEHGYTEDRYVRMLKPVMYTHKGECLGYGLKFWPRDVATLMASNKNLKWIKEEFGR